MPAITIAHFADEILGNAARRGLAGSTVRQKDQVLRELVALKDGSGKPLVRKTSDLTEKTIGAWVEAFPTRTAGTVKSHLRALRAMTRRAKKRGWLRVDPFDIDDVNDWIRLDARPKAPPRRWSKSPEDIRRLFKTADSKAKGGSWLASRDRAYVYTLFLTGARPGEIERLDVADFNPQFRTLTISAKWITGRGGRRYWWMPKTVGSSGTIPLGDELFWILQEWLVRRERHPRRRDECTSLFPGERWWGPWTSGGPGARPLDRLKALAKAAEIGDVWRKSARKGIGAHGKLIKLTSLERTGLFRHADEKTSEAYNDEQVESMRPAVAKIEQFYLHGT
jgi:integrase